MTHIFLQGNIRIGKSTLIQQALKNHIKQVGGYFVQRVWIGDEYKGFAIHSIEKEEYVLSKKVEHMSKVKNLFLYEDYNGKWVSNQNLFEEIVLCSLKNRRTKKLILMDELGGIELKWTGIMNQILKVFDEDIPIIGVLKTPKGLEKMNQKLQLEHKLDEYYKKIYKHPKVQILNVDDENLSRVQKNLLDFARGTCSCERLDGSTD